MVIKIIDSPCDFQTLKNTKNLENHKHPIGKLFSVSFMPITILFTSTFVSTDKNFYLTLEATNVFAYYIYI